jgi:hypothetical protein
VRHVVISSSDGATATAVVDGRATLPFVIGSNTAFFPDGRRAPDVQMPGALAHAIQKRLKDAKRDAVKCWEREVPRLGGGAEGIPPSALASEADFGHFSDTHGSDDCWLCKGKCTLAYASCNLTAGIVGAACGPLAWICVPAGFAACFIRAP